MISCFDRRKLAACKASYPLTQAFIDADVEASTFYRAGKGADLDIRTAKKVMRVFDHIIHRRRPPRA